VGYVGGRGAGTQWESSIASIIYNKVGVHQASSKGLPKTPASTPVASFVSFGDPLRPLDIDRYIFSLPLEIDAVFASVPLSNIN
jgi:hypothetical protein